MSSLFAHYIQNLAAEEQRALTALRSAILSAIPEAEETTSSGVPAFHYRGKYLASLGASKTHLSLFVMRGKAIQSHAAELSDFDATNVVVRFSTDKQIPAALIKKIISYRKTEIESGSA